MRKFGHPDDNGDLLGSRMAHGRLCRMVSQPRQHRTSIHLGLNHNVSTLKEAVTMNVRGLMSRREGLKSHLNYHGVRRQPKLEFWDPDQGVL